MSLIVFLDPMAPERAALWRNTATGETGRDAPLSEVAILAKGQELCVALPGESALSRVLNLPMKRRRDQQRAADLVLEDQLAAPMPERVLAMDRAGPGRKLVTAMPGAVLRDALAALQEEGLDPDILTVDHAFLPEPGEGEATTLDVGDRRCVRTASGAFTAEPAFAEAVLQAEEEVSLRAVDGEGLLALSAVPNFRQGALAKRRPLPNLRPYALAAGLVLAAGAVFLLSSLVEGARYAGAAGKLEREAEAAFLTARPNTPIVEIERQLRAAGRGPAQSDFLPLTAALADVLDEHEAASLSSLAYDREGQLTAELTFSSFGDLEAVTAALSERGVITEEAGDARREDGAFVTRLYLRAA